MPRSRQDPVPLVDLDVSARDGGFLILSILSILCILRIDVKFRFFRSPPPAWVSVTGTNPFLIRISLIVVRLPATGALAPREDGSISSLDGAAI